MRDTIDLDAGERPWSLAALAERAELDRHIETVATAIADRFTLKVHINVAARDAAFADWIDRVRAEDGRRLDHRSFVAVCAGLIAALAARRVVSYSALVGDPSDGMLGTILAYGNEVTALAAGAAVYALAVADLTGTLPAEPLPALVVENAAASLRKHPEAALRFRELLRLTTPWM
jgi:hypothetical protein